MNDGPLCRCSWKAKQTGIAHSIYPGEKVRFINFFPFLLKSKHFMHCSLLNRATLIQIIYTDYFIIVWVFLL